MSTPTHSPLPWTYGMQPLGTAYALALVSGDLQIAHIYTGYGTGEANAELIVRAVNAHESLVAALQEIIALCPSPKLPYGFQVVEIATTALAKAAPAERLP